MQNKQMENAINEVNEKYRNKRDGYTLSYSECVELTQMATMKPFDAALMSFDYGFMKGIRFAKAMMKKGERI